MQLKRRRRALDFVDIGKKLFDTYPVKFPIDDYLSIVHGLNGTGKTKTLEVLAEYFEEQGENVVYLPADRFFSFDAEEVDALEVMWAMTDERNVMKRYNFTVQPWDVEGMKGEYINSGMLQIINLFGTIAQLEKPSVIIIDMLERSLHAMIRKQILSDLLDMAKVKKLIITSYSPEVYEDYSENTVEIGECVNLREK